MKYEIGSRIKKYRELAGLSQKEFAEILGISNSRVSNWEQGINRPDADILAAICRALKVSPSELLNVHLPDGDEFTSKERRLILSYREKEDLPRAVNILLDVDYDSYFYISPPIQ